MTSCPEITVHELAEELKSGATPTLLDVREPEELEISKIEGVLNIPEFDLAERLSELDPEHEIVVICRTGNRSGNATSLLIEHGFSNVKNMVGGMNLWATEIDTSLRTY